MMFVVDSIAGVLFRLPGLTCIIMQYRAEDRSNLLSWIVLRPPCGRVDGL